MSIISKYELTQKKVNSYDGRKEIVLIFYHFRWLAFIIMVVLACNNIIKNKTDLPTPPTANIDGLPNLFGVCVYSFMCHHSLPSLITPISQKKRLYPLILGDYVIIMSFYFLLAFTGIFAFRELNDLYTLNFQVIFLGTTKYFGIFPLFWSWHILILCFQKQNWLNSLKILLFSKIENNNSNIWINNMEIVFLQR